MKREKNRNITAFTLVELLTTLAVIGILLALLIPALNQVGKTAAKVKQKAQFHSIEIGLEAFHSDTGDYPTSIGQIASGELYTSSHILAEAMVGRDGFGYHPDSSFSATNTLYAPVVNLTADTDNLNSRKGPYLELENANAVKISSIYHTPGMLVDSYVLVDNFKKVKNLTTGQQIGMPIIYYKANATALWDWSSSAQAVQSTYSIVDALGRSGMLTEGIAGRYVPFLGTGTQHPMANQAAGGWDWFYNRIQNPNFTNPPRPYRAESFILHSAGPDGLYGTTDDMFNFDQEN